jgi:hypothetical protein
VIITTHIDVKIASSNIKYYKNLGYDVNVKDIIKIPLEHLPLSSNYKIESECFICKSRKSIIYNAYNRYIRNSKDNNYRCNKCNTEVSKNTKLLKYGDKNYTNRKKYKETCLERYGGHFNKLDEFKNKKRETCLERYGVEHPIRNEKVKEKKKNTCLERYGVENPLNNPEILLKSKKKMIDKHGHEYSMQCLDISEKIISNSKLTKKYNLLKRESNILEVDYNENKYVVFCDICENRYEITPHMYTMRKKSNTIICTKCNKIDDHRSGKELSLLNIIKNIYNGEIILNSRGLIPPFEIDIFLPELKIAFEYNGLYWHSELHKEKNYHKDKSDMCDKNGIKLIHIWEDDLDYKSDIIKSIINTKLNKTEKIFARNCEIREVMDNGLIRDFLNKNHLQGFVGSKFKIGLFYKNELVSLMTFGNLRKSLGQIGKEGSYELIRFCNKLNTSIVGGASKLFKYFIKNHEINEIVSYADRSYFDGSLYEKLGFILENKTEPNYYYIVNNIRKNRFGYRKDILVRQGFDESKTEDEIMKSRGIYRIYNSGNLKFIYKNQKTKLFI